MSSNPLYNRPTYGAKPGKRPLTAAEAQAELLRQRMAKTQTSAPQATPPPQLQPQEQGQPKVDYGKVALDAGKDAATNYAIEQGLDYALGGSGASSGAGAGTSVAGAGAPPSTPVIVNGTSTAGAGTPMWSYNSPSYAGYLTAAYDLYSGAKNWDDWKKQGDDYAATKAEQSVAKAVGDAYTGGLVSLADGALRTWAPHFMNELDKFGNKYGPMGNLVRTFGSTKDKGQLGRDAVRGRIIDTGLLDEGYNLTLADNSKFDIGKDGSVKNYNVDFNQEGVGDVVAMANPLAAILTGGNEKLTSDFAGYLTNAARSSGDPKANMMKFFGDAKLDHATAYKIVDEMATREKNPIKKELADAYKNGLDQFFGVGAYGSSSGKIPMKRKSGGGKSKEEQVASPPVAPPSAPVAPPPPVIQTAQPVDERSYIDAIVQVNNSNTSRANQNPLYRRLYEG